MKDDADALPLATAASKVLVTGASVTHGAGRPDRRARSGRDGVRHRDRPDRRDDRGRQWRRRSQSDQVVVATNKAWTSAGQQKLVKQLVATGKPVVVVAVRDPYDIAYFTDAPTYLATYSTTAISMESLARVLFGEVQPGGKLPVDIPVAGDPGTALYPFGHGLASTS